MFSLFKKVLHGNDDKVIEKDALIIDVRSKSEFASGHISSAINIPLEQVELELEGLKTHPQLVVYCRSGNRSAHAKKILLDNGINNVVDAGSFN